MFEDNNTKSAGETTEHTILLCLSSSICQGANEGEGGSRNVEYPRGGIRYTVSYRGYPLDCILMSGRFCATRVDATQVLLGGLATRSYYSTTGALRPKNEQNPCFSEAIILSKFG